ncbi:MAG: sirohydrochlorin cobaltochelatase [Desulfuromonadaceae bacterium]|nr:sirohydrochlorin cobaltochelatase [Desulfuromonadaceae bacterium]
MESHAVSTGKTAIVVASFGTTYPRAVNALPAIVQDIQTAYPHTPVQMAFTSNIIRKKWHSRATDADYRKAHPQVPEFFYRIKNILGTLADLQDQGYKTIVVQPTLLTHGEEFLDLTADIEGLRLIKTTSEHWRPFNKIALGRPLMGTWGSSSPYTDDLARLARAVAEDVEAAQQANAALVYMGHGNKHLSTGLYYEFELLMNRHYPQIKTIVGLLKGHPNLDEVLTKLQQTNSKKVLLKPLMIVAGNHAANDMAGTEENSWKALLHVAGFRVNPVLQGLGDNAAVRRMFIDHLQDAATEAGIELR